ncbi:hypothetical protein [Aurantiacibacter rhizosphaerae]|uniref:Uncharacterized protein n=1 Tax=Aurantiacibacter rhizosphaerae TaxID=2691582 RepID=A0A844XEA5_9SPHN|nr:hypothetical protein [Aurantiacibacter rhizosphaerae]MWV28346.1 hypothetical protein [Aurantiacibacter rhizosphaerae]
MNLAQQVKCGFTATYLIYETSFIPDERQERFAETFIRGAAQSAGRKYCPHRQRNCSSRHFIAQSGQADGNDVSPDDQRSISSLSARAFQKRQTSLYARFP